MWAHRSTRGPPDGLQLPRGTSPSPLAPTSLPSVTHVRDRLPVGKPAPVAC